MMGAVFTRLRRHSRPLKPITAMHTYYRVARVQAEFFRDSNMFLEIATADSAKYRAFYDRCIDEINVSINRVMTGQQAERGQTVTWYRNALYCMIKAVRFAAALAEHLTPPLPRATAEARVRDLLDAIQEMQYAYKKEVAARAKSVDDLSTWRELCGMQQMFTLTDLHAERLGKYVEPEDFVAAIYSAIDALFVAEIKPSGTLPSKEASAKFLQASTEAIVLLVGVVFGGPRTQTLTQLRHPFLTVSEDGLGTCACMHN